MTASYTPHHDDPVLDRLPLALVEGLRLSRHRRIRIARGRSMIADGSPVTAVYLVSEGWAVSKMTIDTGDTQILDILGPGSFAGISRLDDSTSHDYSAIALQDIEVYRIETRELQDICAKSEELSHWLTDTVSLQAQRTQRHLTALGQLPARGRLAFVMLRILDIAQQMGESAVDKTIRLPMTQEEIGNMLGLTNVSISKLMSAFRKEGLIDYGRNRIVVRDVKALSDISGMKLEELRATSSSRSTGDASFNDVSARSGR